MKSRGRGGFLLGVFATVSLAALLVLIQASTQPASARTERHADHAPNCHAPAGAKESK